MDDNIHRLTAYDERASEQECMHMYLGQNITTEALRSLASGELDRGRLGLRGGGRGLGGGGAGLLGGRSLGSSRLLLLGGSGGGSGGSGGGLL